MAGVPKMFSNLYMLVTLALIVNADNHPTRLDTFQEKTHEKETINPADYRLPKSIIPMNYDIKISSVNFGNFTFEGTCTITAQVKESVDEILLNAGSITVNVNTIVVGKEKFLVDNAAKNQTTEIFKISLKNKLAVNSTVQITLSFNGKLRDDMIGFYKSSYFNDEGKQRWLAATQFESTHARHAFPCFDEPEFKAQFDIAIKVPDSSYNCLSNMEFQFDNNTNWCQFKKTQKMSTYLVAFVISDFRPDPKNDALLKLWARPNAQSQAVYGQEIGTKILKKFGEIFGQEYYDETTKKMDMVAVPDFSAGAMENWGLITYREATGLYDKDHSTDANQQYVASVIVHECAHMWFGNLVTPDWWNNLWLSEAFARYYQYMGTDMITDNWKMAEQFIVEQFHTAMGVDSVEDSKPMTRPEGDLITPEQISSAGGTITYNKGASIVRMMEKTFGKDEFYKSLKSYLSDRKLQSANPDHLWEAFQKNVESDVNVSTIMKTWTEHAGYPYITVEVKPQSIKLRQDRFFLRHSNNLPQHSWTVPITLSSSNNLSDSTKPDYWLSKHEDEINRDNEKDDWLILNVQSAGFYRVNYDKKSWERIINLLTKGDYTKLHVTNRAAIVDDLLNFARAEIIDYELAFRGIQYLKREKDYLPFYSALKGLDYLSRVTAESSDYDFLKNYTTSLIEDVYRDLTFDDKTGDDRLTTLLRRELNSRACGFDDASCVDKSLKYFKDWKTNNKNLVPKNQRSVVYCTAMRHGTADDWDFLYKQYRKANVAAEQTTILSALGCSQDIVVLEKYLLNALSGFEKSFIRAQDISSVFNGVYTASLKNAIFMIDFADKNHKALHDYHKKYDAIGSLITGALQRYPIKKLVEKVEKIVEKNATHIASNSASIKKSLTSVKQEMDLFKKCLPPAIDSLKETDPSVENTTAYRLPTNIIPSHYQIYLAPHISPEENFTFDGEVKITAEVNRTLKKITLHTDQLNILSIKIININDKEKPLELKHSTPLRREKYHFTDIPMENYILEGTKIIIEIKYTGTLNTEMRGFYRSSYKTKSETRWLAATQLEPTAARRVFPAFDEPALKATFSISVQTIKSFTVLSNTKHKSNEKSLWVFEDTPRMSTYLIAVVVCDFSDLSTEDAKHEYHVWTNDLVIGQAAYALEVMGPVTRWFENKLGHDFSMKKLAQVALPDFTSGAMENWGLLTYRETNLLYDPEKMSSLANKQSIRNVIAHEITHQWFGDLVSPLWWNYTWLNEGFARYFQCHAYTQNETDWNLETQFVVDHLQTSFSKDGSTSTHAITPEVYSPTQIKAIFDSISYAKAASIIRMLEKLTGPKIFYDALNKYLEACKFDAGTPEHLFKAFQNEVDSDKTIKNFNVTRLMNSWTLQKGFPVLNIEFKDDETATIKQSRFYQRAKKEDSTTWEIPLSWATKSNPNFNDTRDITWIRNKHNFVTIKREKDDWVIFNVQQMGYFRVNYDEKMWNLIIKALNSSEYTKIHEINRANIIDDLLHLGQLGQIPYSLVFSGVSYLAHETEYAPWKAAFTGLSYLNRRFDGRPEIYNSYKEFMIRLLEPTFKRLKFNDQKNDRTRDILLRHQALNWLCEFDHEECIKEALAQFAKEKNSKDEKDAVAPNKRSYVYCTAIKKGNDQDWEYLWQKLVESVYATERISILGALACSENPVLLKRLMDETIKENSEVRLQDSKTVFSNIVNSGLIGVATALDFISVNYEEMNKRLGDESIAKSTLDTISKRVSTKQLLKKFDEVVKNCEKTMPGICNSLQSYLNRANEEMKWFTEKTSKIFEWLQSKNIEKQIGKVENRDYRLPNFAKPEAYEIFMTPYFEEKNFTFEGEVIIDIKINEPTFSIVLHQYALNIKSIEAKSGTKEYEPMNIAYNPITHQLTIFFKDSFESETTFKLKIQYDGVLRDDMRGFYRSSYIDENNKTKWLASTHFEPTYARRAFPCMDEPSFKATFTLHLSTPKGYHALSNKGSNPAKRPDGERTWNDFEPSLKMSPYLLAFVVSEYEKTSDPKSKRVAAWSRPQLKPFMVYAPPTGEASLKFLENFTKIEYPLEESNLISIPDFDMGAMENWGLVTFREYGLTYSAQLTSASYKRYVNTVISHELVHQWFGNLVTCAWWDYTWLNEGFADYVSYLISDTIEPKWQLMKQFVIKELHAGLESDSSNSSHPMNNKVFTPAEAQDGFDRIAYQKSGSVLRMLHNSFGDKVFVEAIQAYLKAKSYDVAHPEDLYKAMEERMSKETKKPGELKVDVTTVMKSWTEQAGYPVVQATRVKDQVTLSQTRFLSSSTSESKKNETYWVPITYTSETTPNFESLAPKLWLNDKPAKIPIAAKEKWFIVNVQQIGFYRVNYDSDNWKALINLLNSDNFTTIPEVNRAQLIDDLFNLARGEKYGIDYGHALDASQYLERETNFLPWSAYFTATAYLNQRLEGNQGMKKLYTQHVLTIIDKVYKKLGFKEDVAKDDHLDQLNRELITTWACKYGHKDCVDKAKKFISDRQTITANIATAVYCTAVEHGDSKVWDDVWDRYTNALLATDYLTILRGLGCSKDAKVLEKYLERIIEPASKIRRQDAGTAFASIYTSSQVGLNTALQFFSNNLVKLKEFYGDWHEVGSLLSSMAGRISNDEQIGIIEKLKTTTEAKNIESSIDSAVKAAKKNLDWFKTNSNLIQKWLGTNYEEEKEEKTTNKPGSAYSQV